MTGTSGNFDRGEDKVEYKKEEEQKGDRLLDKIDAKT